MPMVRGLHLFPCPLILSLPCPVPLNLSSLYYPPNKLKPTPRPRNLSSLYPPNVPNNPNQLVDVSQGAQLEL